MFTLSINPFFVIFKVNNTYRLCLPFLLTFLIFKQNIYSTLFIFLEKENLQAAPSIKKTQSKSSKFVQQKTLKYLQDGYQSLGWAHTKRRTVVMQKKQRKIGFLLHMFTAASQQEQVPHPLRTHGHVVSSHPLVYLLQQTSIRGSHALWAVACVRVAFFWTEEVVHLANYI